MGEARWALADVTVRLGGVTILDRIDLSVLDGITAIVGPSGAGKTTLLNVLVGFQRITGGTLRGPDAAIAWGPADGFWQHLTVRGHLLAVGAADPEKWLDRFGLRAAADRRPAQCSAGERARLAVVRALATPAPLVVLDEPLAHCDPALADRCWQELEAAALGRCVVFTSHEPARVVGWAHRTIGMMQGRVVMDLPTAAAWRTPPDAASAQLLGPAAWFDAHAATAWLECPGPCCLRPMQLEVRADAVGPLTVLAQRDRGERHESRLDGPGGERLVAHRPGPLLPAGTRVRLVPLLAALLIMLLAACGSAPQTPPTRVVVLPPEGTRLPAPRALANCADGGWLSIDTDGRVLRFDRNAALVHRWTMSATAAGRPENLVELRDGRIAVADTHYHRVVVFSATGALLTMFGSAGDEPGQFRFPVGICRDDADHLFVSEYDGNDRIQKFSPELKPVLAFGRFGTGPGEFQRPQTVKWLAGLLYVADALNNRVQVFRDDGTFVRVLCTDLTTPYGLGLIPGPGLAVAEYGAGRMTRLDLTGKIISRWGSPGRGDGQLATPWNLASQPDGRIWIADTGNRRIVEVGP